MCGQGWRRRTDVITVVQHRYSLYSSPVIGQAFTIYVRYTTMQRLRKLKVTKRTKKSKVPLESLLKVHYNEEDDRPLLNVESVPENMCCYGEHSILKCGFCPHCVQETSSRDERDERICSSNQSPEKNASSRNIYPSSSNLDG